MSTEIRFEPAGGLQRYDAACRAISEAMAVDELQAIRDHAMAMVAAARIAKNKQAETDLMTIRFRAERRLGELIARQREAGLLSRGAKATGSNQHQVRVASGPAPISLAEAGIDKHLADRARKYAAVPAQQFEQRIAEYRAKVEEEGERVTADLLSLGKPLRGTFNTGEFEWYTPADYVELARRVLGDIDLDPASSDLANLTVQAATFYSQQGDGLAQAWTGRVWMNPPYAQPLISHFASKLVKEVKAGAVTSAIALTNDCTDTAWFHELAGASAAFCLTRGRIRFVSPKGNHGSPTQGQAFFYFGEDTEAFADVFNEVGLIVEIRG